MAYDYAVLSTVRVVDGDTVYLQIDLGFHLTAALDFRLLNCDAPEHSEKGWAECKAFLATFLIDHAGHLRVATEKSDDFGRWLADLYALEMGGRVIHYADRLNEEMAKNAWTSPSRH